LNIAEPGSMDANEHLCSIFNRLNPAFSALAAVIGLTGCIPSLDGLTGGIAGAGGAIETSDASGDGTGGPSLDGGDTTLDGGSSTPGDGAADADGGGCIVDFNADKSQNCGVCGRDCELGKCVDGACMPYTFVSDQAPVQLAIDHASVYWTNAGAAGSVYSIARSGTGGAKLLVSGQKNPAGIAVTTNRIYWVEQGTADVSGKIVGSDGDVMSSALDGSDVALVGSSFKRPVSLVVDSGRVYVAEHGINDISKPSDGDIASCALPACSDRHTHGDIAIFPLQLLLHGGSLWWTSETSDSDMQFGSIWQVPLTNGAQPERQFPMTKVQSYRMAFSPDGSTLLYTSKNFQSITRHPLGPGDVTQLHFNFEPRAVLDDGSDLFAIAAADYTGQQSNMGALLRVPDDGLTTDGTPPASLKKYPVARGGDAIVDGGRSVYFTTETSIMKLVK
jgi:hypothetical protein